MGNSLKDITKDKESIILDIGVKESFYIVAEVQQQKDMIYALLLFLVKLNKDKNKSKEEKVKEKNLNITYSENKSKDSKEKGIKKRLSQRIDVEINNFELVDLKLLKDDSYLPSGIILRSHVLKQHKKVKLSSLDRYIVLGNSHIIIFKDESMNKICNVIPIIHCNILFNFNEQNLKMKIRLTTRKYVLIFKTIDELQIWRSVN